MEDNKLQIEEIAKVIDSDCYACKNCDVLRRYKKQDGFEGISCSSIKKAEDCYKIVIPEDSVVMTREEYENIYEQAEQNVLANIADGGTSCHWCIEQHERKACKEMAEKIWRKVINLLKIFEVDNIYLLESVYALAKQDGIEVK